MTWSPNYTIDGVGVMATQNPTTKLWTIQRPEGTTSQSVDSYFRKFYRKLPPSKPASHTGPEPIFKRHPQHPPHVPKAKK